MYPASAELLLDVLRDGAQDRQVLVTTHSPDLLEAGTLSADELRVVVCDRGHTRITRPAPACVDALREGLYTPGELLRSDELLPAEELSTTS